MNSSALKTQFKCLKKLGVGGTAEVYLATSESYPHPIALKKVLPSSDVNSFRHLAQREAALIEGLNYPGLVRLYQVNTSDDPHIVLEYCTGTTLEDFKTENIQTIYNILSSAAVNLEYLRLIGIVHGDFKPENIFLPADSDFSGLFFSKFSDFSLGRKFDEPESERAGVGTLGYSAPETIGQNQTDHRSDLFALGVIAFQLLSGEHPLCNDFSDPVKVNGAIQENEPKDLTQLCPDLSPELVELVLSLLAKDPGKRPNSGWEVCQKLEALGATYPYRKALAPKYLFSPKLTIEQIYERLELSDKQQQELIYKANNDQDLLRLILEYNFIKDNLSYNGNRYLFSGQILFPPYLIRTFVKEFSSLKFSEQKEMISLALASYVNRQIETEVTEADQSRYLYEIILNLLSIKTIRTQSRKLIYNLASDDYPEKAILATLVGDINLAEDSAFQAATNLSNEKKFSEALNILNSVIRFLKVSHNRFKSRQLLKLKGSIYKDMGEIEKAEKVLLEVVNLYDDEQNDALLAETYKQLGNVYKFKQHYQKGSEALDKALRIYEELNDELEISHTYNNIGNMFWVANNYKDALSSYRKAMRIQRRLNAREGVASSITNIGSIFAMQGNFKRALKILNISLKLKKELGNLGEIARTLNNLGYLHHIMDNNDKAIETLLESLEYNRRIGNKKEILINMDNLISMMFISGDINKTIALLKEGLALTEELEDIPNNALFSVYMGSVLSRLGKIDDALLFFDRAEQLIANTDDIVNRIILNTEKIKTFNFVGDNSAAEAIINDTIAIADDINEQNYKVGFLLVAYQITGTENLFMEADKICSKLDLKREKFILYKTRLAHLIEKKETESADELYPIVLEMIKSRSNDIELSDACLTMAEYHLSHNKIEEATSCLNKASDQIQSQSLAFEMMKLRAQLGQVKFIGNDYEGCFAEYKKALTTAKEIAGNISDINLRNRFQSKPIIGFLVRNIKEFSQKIAKK